MDDPVQIQIGDERFGYVENQLSEEELASKRDLNVPVVDTSLPNFQETDMPYIRVKHLHLRNYKIFDDFEVDFTNEGQTKLFACFIGPNGCGKSTMLEIIQTLFSNYGAYDKIRCKSMLGKCVRHTKAGDQSGIYGDADFSVKAQIESSLGDYEIELTKEGFQQEHPERIRSLAYRLCYIARFDQELRRVQIPSSKWEVFKELFEAVTGFEIEKEETAFAVGESKMQQEYVFGFNVHKPNETIHWKECSDGERKIMKTFAGLLQLEYTPSIILVDNVGMHVESGRHLPLIQSLRKCFKNSQIVTTTHSYHITRNFSEKNQVYDLRLLSCSEIYRQEPWRLQVADEIKDALIRAKTLEDARYMQDKGSILLARLDGEISNKGAFRDDLKELMCHVTTCYINDLISLEN